MSAKRFSIVFLAALAVGGQAWGQGDGNRPVELTIRDFQGKLITVPPGNPAKPFNYVKWLNDTLSKGITDNAAETYIKAYKLFQYMEGDDEPLYRAMAGPWESLPAVSAWLKTNQPCLQKFREAAGKRQCYFQLGDTNLRGEQELIKSSDPRAEGWIMHVACDGVARHRGACKALLVEGWRVWKQGNEDGLIENAMVVIGSGNHLDTQPMIIQHLVGLACKSMAYEALIKAMSVSSDPDAFATRLAESFTAASDPPTDPGRTLSLNLEYPLMRDSCQRIFMPGKESGTWRVSEDILAILVKLTAQSGEKPEDVKAQIVEIGYPATVRECDELAKRFSAWLAKPSHVAAKETEAFDEAIEKSKNPLVKRLASGLTRARTLDDGRQCWRRAAHLIMQLHIYHAKHKAFPDKLDDLQAPNLKEIRIDPFSGKDFVYKKQGKSFLLYTVAYNCKDDGGKHSKIWDNNDVVFWPVPAEGK